MTVGEQKSGLHCHLCGNPLDVRLARGRKSGKPFVLMVCPVDGRHIRAFVGDADYVRKLMDQVEAKAGR